MTEGWPQWMIAPTLSLASMSATSTAPPVRIRTTIGFLAAAETALTSACWPSDSSIEVRSWPSCSIEPSCPTTITTSSAALAAATAAGICDRSEDVTEGTPSIEVTSACSAIASTAVYHWLAPACPGQGWEPP